MKQSPTSLAGRERAEPTRPDLWWKMLTSWPERASDDELRLARASGANVLLIGHDPEVSDAAAFLAGSAPAPALSIWTGDGLRLPRQAPHGVVVARDVDGLLPEEQLKLLRWLDQASEETRIISTASPSLWPMVRGGAFDHDLYYRLNTVCIPLL